MHIIEGSSSNWCSGSTITNNDIGPAGTGFRNSPRSSFFKFLASCQGMHRLGLGSSVVTL